MIVNILAAYTLIPNIPNMDKVSIKAEASKVCAYLDSEILRSHSKSTYIHVRYLKSLKTLNQLIIFIYNLQLCTAFIVLHSSFTLDINTSTMGTVYHELSKMSYGMVH